MTRTRRLCVLTTLLLALSALAFVNVPPAMASPATIDTFVNPKKQREASIAVNPTKPDNIVIGFNDYNPFGYSVASYVYSTDGGATWTYGGMLPSGLDGVSPWCDPWLAFDSTGYLYYVALGYHDWGAEVFVSVAEPDASGDVGPLGFGGPQIVATGGPNDKPALAVDRTGGTYDGNIYVVWSHESGAGKYKIWFRRGTRTGPTTITWTEPGFQVSPAGVLYTQGAVVAIGPNGEVYVAHAKMTSASIPDQDEILFSRSLNGGAPGTWTTGILVSSVDAVDWFVDNTNQGARHSSFPTIGVSQTSGTIFVAWADDRNGDDDVLLAKSADNGNTWSATPIRVNNDAIGNGKDQFHPALTVTPGGVVDVIFYDRRDDPANKLFNVYLARSWDEGTSWSNSIITDAVTNPDVFSTSQGGLGDYIGITSESISVITDRTFMAWADGRVGNTAPRDYNTDIFFDTRDVIRLVLIDVFIMHPELILIRSCVPPWRCPIRVPIELLSIHGFKNAVSLRAEGVPTWADYYFDNATGVPPFKTALNIVTNEYFEEGTFEVQIVASSGNTTRTQSFKVVFTATPYILLETLVANPGEIITLEGHGFTADSFFDVFFDDILLKTDKVDSEGMISTEIRVAGDTPDGNHTVLVKDEAGIEAKVTLLTPIIDEETEEGAPIIPVGGVVVQKDTNIEPPTSWIFLGSTVITITIVAAIRKRRKRQTR